MTTNELYSTGLGLGEFSMLESFFPSLAILSSLTLLTSLSLTAS